LRGDSGKVKTTVFLAEDHAVVRDGLRLLIQAEGDLDVIGEATDGAEALRMIPELRPDVGVIDIAMPGMTGLELIEQLDGGDAFKPIILSMHAEPEQVFRALKSGARGYLLKESAGAEVVEAIRSVAAGNRYLGHRITEIMVCEYIHQRDRGRTGCPVDTLSAREREVLRMMAEGRTSSEMGDILLISPKTVETYRRRISQKLGISDLPSLVKFAIANGLTTL
jgi:DNA-binding NarL/FixJ family response regulator